jgi:hypothetical protein
MMNQDKTSRELLFGPLAKAFFAGYQSTAFLLLFSFIPIKKQCLSLI